MVQRKILLKDRELVKQRLAQGVSTREAIKGTAIKSPQTATNISKQEVDEIGQIREKYLKAIREFGAGELKRAELWAQMAEAMKPIGATILVDKDGKTVKSADEGVIEVPDWFNRREALKYIDNLAGISNTVRDEGTQVNILNVVGTDQKKYGF